MGASRRKRVPFKSNDILQDPSANSENPTRNLADIWIDDHTRIVFESWDHALV